jgi:hypothetical protein
MELTITDQQKEFLHLCIIEQLKYDQIAEKMGVPRYLYMMENISYSRYAPDQLEMFLFQFGNNLKHPIGEEGFIEDVD